MADDLSSATAAMMIGLVEETISVITVGSSKTQFSVSFCNYE